jgi:hypothetical protein
MLDGSDMTSMSGTPNVVTENEWIFMKLVNETICASGLLYRTPSHASPSPTLEVATDVPQRGASYGATKEWPVQGKLMDMMFYPYAL